MAHTGLPVLTTTACSRGKAGSSAGESRHGPGPGHGAGAECPGGGPAGGDTQRLDVATRLDELIDVPGQPAVAGDFCLVAVSSSTLLKTLALRQQSLQHGMQRPWASSWSCRDGNRAVLDTGPHVPRGRTDGGSRVPRLQRAGEAVARAADGRRRGGLPPDDDGRRTPGFPHREEDLSRALVVTFDDGFLHFHSHALPALSELNVPATLFVPPAYVGDTSRWPA